MAGVTAEYTEAMLRAAVEAYDPALHPAPLVVGHPHHNHPAYGWVGKLSLDEQGNVVAEPSDVNPDFAELVQRRAYRTRSASWYLPDAPNNPKPGSMYLRHVGFLGAQPPAIKGLKDVQFAESEPGVVEFADAEVGLMATFLRRLREWFLSEHGKDKADEVAPDWMVGEFEALARAPMKDSSAAPAYAEQPPNSEQESTVSAEKIAAMEAENARMKAELEAARAAAAQTQQQQSAEFAEKEAELERRAAELAKKEIETTVDGLIAAGKVLPAQKAHVVAFAASLSDQGECIDFAEPGKGKDVQSQRASYLRMLEAGPKLVEFSERAKDERQGQGNARTLTEIEIGRQAADFIEEQSKKGITVSATQAVTHIMAQQEKLAG